MPYPIAPPPPDRATMGLDAVIDLSRSVTVTDFRAVRRSGMLGVIHTATEGGDKFNPNDQVALTPLAGTFREGQSFTARYSDSWSEITPQATIEFKPNDDMLFCGTFSTGYKGGGFEDDPANAAAAVSSYDPETVTSFEIGGKLDLFDRRLRLNVALFDMKYKNLQVTQTSAVCLCNITDNAADAKIQGIEAEATVAVATGLTLSFMDDCTPEPFEPEPAPR